jgi:hypothetical protein
LGFRALRLAKRTTTYFAIAKKTAENELSLLFLFDEFAGPQ